MSWWPWSRALDADQVVEVGHSVSGLGEARGNDLHHNSVSAQRGTELFDVLEDARGDNESGEVCYIRIDCECEAGRVVCKQRLCVYRCDRCRQFDVPLPSLS